MSILIKGDIGLPRDCCKCPFNCYGLCLANHSKLSVDKCVKSRHSDCPLVEVPTPHGRLIDADAFLKWLKEFHPSDVAIMSGIKNARTIIEAEVSKNGCI